MKNFLTIVITKILIIICKIIGKNGGNIPGRYAYKINKDILKYFKVNCPIVAVVGTNGKTTTNNIINSIIKNEYSKVIGNLSGNNMETGIISLLAKNCTLTGKVKADFITLEIDESYLPIVGRKLKIDTIVLLDFFRDQLDRVGEVESLILKINEFLKDFNGNLVLNNDDPNVARLGKANPNNKKIYYFSVDRYKYATDKMKEAGEGKFCPFCNTKLEYEYYQYAHIGKFKCPKCNYGDNKIYKFITNIDLEKKEFYIEKDLFKIKYNSIYSIYNFAAAISVATLYKVDIEEIKHTIKEFELNNGRQEKLVIKNCNTIINLAKNPTGANVSLRIVNEDSEEKDLLFVLNDNSADGTDVSWIYDIDFSNMKNVNRYITSGTRAYDMAICIKTSGVLPEKIESYLNLDEAVKALYKTKQKKYVISNYTAIQATRNSILKLKHN